MRVPQRDLTAMHDDAGLAANQGAQAALQARLKLAAHESVVCARLVQNIEVDVKKADIDAKGDGGPAEHAHLQTSK